MAVGDVIYIEANSGAVKRVGRSDAFATEFDLEAEEYVPLPKGEVHKKKEIVQVTVGMIIEYSSNVVELNKLSNCSIFTLSCAGNTSMHFLQVLLLPLNSYFLITDSCI